MPRSSPCDIKTLTGVYNVKAGDRAYPALGAPKRLLNKDLLAVILVKLWIYPLRGPKDADELRRLEIVQGNNYVEEGHRRHTEASSRHVRVRGGQASMYIRHV